MESDFEVGDLVFAVPGPWGWMKARQQLLMSLGTCAITEITTGVISGKLMYRLDARAWAYRDEIKLDPFTEAMGKILEEVDCKGEK